MIDKAYKPLVAKLIYSTFALIISLFIIGYMNVIK
jgi:hypothetical protein